MRGELGRKEDSRRPVCPTDDTNSPCFVGSKAPKKSKHISPKDTKLRCRPNEHELGIGDKSREVGHRSDAQENKRRIPALPHPLVEDIEHRALFVNTDLQTCILKWDIADEHTKANRDE